MRKTKHKFVQRNTGFIRFRYVRERCNAAAHNKRKILLSFGLHCKTLMFFFREIGKKSETKMIKLALGSGINVNYDICLVWK